MQHLGTKELSTKRLYLRPFTIHDANAMYHNWASDEEVTKYLTWQPHATIDVTQSVLQDWIHNYTSPDYYQWAVILQDTGDEPIGCIGVVDKSDSIQMVHIGYCLGKKWWHQGIMSEALSAVINFFFQEVKMNRIESSHDILNPHSGDVMKKCGMTYEGIARETGLNNQGELCDMARYAILQKDIK